MLAIQKEYYKTGVTLSVDNRIANLKALKKKIIENETAILDALYADLGKSHYEGFLCEVGLVLDEINYMCKNIKKFTRTIHVKTPITNFPGRSFRKPSPYGNVLIMSPWNYPFLLTLDPLIDAIAAGNTVILKPSAYSPATSAIIKKMMDEVYPIGLVNTVEGGRAVNQTLLDQKFDYIFFTGGKVVGRTVMEKAAVHLTPMTLELGGKSPCIVDETANLKVAAARLAFGKFVNVGQTCVAPDYLLVQKDVKEEFLKLLILEIKKQYGDNPLANPDYGKIITQKHFERINGLIEKDKVICGGDSNPETNQIAPTVLDNCTLESPSMGEEIFGPVLPVLTFNDIEEIFPIIEKNSTPLALYIFSTNKERINNVTDRISFGGGCINDTIIHLASAYMPFGGVGESGMGCYHGKYGFDTFSHYKSMIDKKTWMDLDVRYQPYTKKKEKLIRMIMK